MSVHHVLTLLLALALSVTACSTVVSDTMATREISYQTRCDEDHIRLKQMHDGLWRAQVCGRTHVYECSARSRPTLKETSTYYLRCLTPSTRTDVICTRLR